MPQTALLGEVEQLVLLAVLKLEGAAYAVPIRDVIRRHAHVDLSRGSIYITLDRLEKKGYVASEFSEPLQTRGGKARRMFTVRPAGVAALRQSRRALERLSAGTILTRP